MQEIASYFTAAGVPEGGEMFEGISNLFQRTDKEKEGKVGNTLKEASELAGELLSEVPK